MGKVKSKNQTIPVPEKLVEALFDRSESLLKTHDQLEDFFMSQNPNLIKKLHKARSEHKKGETIPFEALRRKYVSP